MQKTNLSYYPNILLIAGAGRNAGKTTLACKIIEYLTKNFEVTGIKISPHMHDIQPKKNVIMQTKNYYIIKENKNSNKDSSRMLKAGAEQVFYVQVKQDDHLKEAFQTLLPYINNKPVVTESGGLHQIIKPGLFMFAHRENNIPDNKKAYLQYNPILVDVFKFESNFNIQNIKFVEEGFIYKTE